MKYHGKQIWIQVIILFVLVIFSIWTLFPFYWMITASFKNRLQTFAPPTLFFTPTLKNYTEAFSLYGSLGKTFINSLIICAVSVALSLLLGIPAAYALGRLNFKGKNNISFFILSLRIMPPVVSALPLYLLAARLNMLDSFTTIIVLYTVFNFPFVIWMLKGFFLEIPLEIEEAAQIDGCSRFGVIRFVFPLISPGVVATAIFSCILTWNEFIAALILTGRHTRTVPVELTTNITSAGIEWGKLMAGGTVALLPILIISIIIQKHLVRGLTLGAVKG
ncbi:MAG: carbohydrate ABC transporter permease [Candidatus Atribacteria bacterium]|nr:carbohydrate ABC transporter permease [Candidatus Atribacteria bacterium]